jgi:SAM-dependent methyltransferase
MTHAFDDDYWKSIWEGELAPSMGASDPNPHLIRETSTLAPGTALDAGCGAGAEAIWLAMHGWQVTAADIATAALERAAERAVASGVGERVKWVEADMSVWDPNTRYDLVTTHYAHPSIPQLDFYDRIGSWVAPGGALLIVGHLHHDSGHGHGDAEWRGDGHSHGRDTPPPAASATAAAITARLDPASWDVVTAEESQRVLARPGGDEVTLHDVVVRATRRT